MNHQIFERMLRFRVLLEAYLFECLFSPLAFSSRVIMWEENRGLWLSSRNIVSSWAQVERRREPSLSFGALRRSSRGYDDLESKRPNQRGATQVKTMLGRRRCWHQREARLDKALPNRPSLCAWSLKTRCAEKRIIQPFGPQIKQEDPLNLSI